MEKGDTALLNVCPACIGEGYDVMITEKENYAQALFQFSNLFRDGWLADVQTPSSARKTQFLRYRNCRFHILQFISRHTAPA